MAEVADLREADWEGQDPASALEKHGIALVDVRPGDENSLMRDCRTCDDPIALVLVTGSNGSGSNSPRWLAFFPPGEGGARSAIGRGAIIPVPRALGIRMGDVHGLIKACDGLKRPQGCHQNALVLIPRAGEFGGFRVGFLNLDGVDSEVAAMIEAV